MENFNKIIQAKICLLLFIFTSTNASRINKNLKLPRQQKIYGVLFQRIERAIGNLIEEIFSTNPNIDELIPFLLELASMHNSSYLILPKESTHQPRDNKIKNFFKRLGIGFIIQSAATIAHETGHAIVAKLCHCTNIKIHLGNKKNLKGPLTQVSIGKLKYFINSPYIINGKATYNLPLNGLSRIQRALIALAGGSSAAISIYLIKVATYLQQHRNQDYISTKERLKDALYQSLTLDSSTTLQITNMLIPLDAQNDGTSFWKAILNK